MIDAPDPRPDMAQLMAQCQRGSAQSIPPTVHFFSSRGREPGSNLPLPSVAMGRLDFKWQRDLRPLSARPTVDRARPGLQAHCANNGCSSPDGPVKTVTMATSSTRPSRG
jgi:hypothetical protein